MPPREPGSPPLLRLSQGRGEEASLREENSALEGGAEGAGMDACRPRSATEGVATVAAAGSSGEGGREGGLFLSSRDSRRWVAFFCVVVIFVFRGGGGLLFGVHFVICVSVAYILCFFFTFFCFVLFFVS